MSFVADNDIPDPVVRSLQAVEFGIKRIRDISPEAITKDREVMRTALNTGDILITCDAGVPSQAYFYELATNGLTVVVLRWKERRPKDFQEMVLAILKDSNSWMEIAARAPSVISVNRRGSRARSWEDIPEDISNAASKD